jgi:hypothetical protein
MNSKTAKRKVCPPEGLVLQLRLVNKEIARLTNALHKAEMRIVQNDEYQMYGYCPCPTTVRRELQIARELKRELMRPWHDDRRLNDKRGV